MFFCLQEKSGPSYASLPAAVVQPEEPALESELDKRGLVDQFVSRDGKVTSRGTLCTEPSSCNTNHVERCIRTMPL